MSAEPPSPSLLPAQPVALPLPPMCLRNEPGPFCTDILGVLWVIQWLSWCKETHSAPIPRFSTLHDREKGEQRGGGSVSNMTLCPDVTLRDSTA